MDESWHAYAACSGMDVDVFFEPPGKGAAKFGVWAEEAKAVCLTCPVRAECLAEGLNLRYGVWGGLTYSERRRLVLSSAPTEYFGRT